MKVLIASPCQQSKLNIIIIAISTLNDLTAKITVYISLWVNFYKLPYT